MRIVTWNCCRGQLSKKLARLTTLEPTFAVIQECAQPKSNDPKVFWQGSNPRQGIGFLVAPDYSVTVEPIRDAPIYNIPVHVEGPRSFFALAVWSQKRSLYVEGVLRAIEAYRDLIVAFPTVVLGDFNSNVLWDHLHSPGRNHTALVQACARLGLVSAYHHHFGEEHGKETRATSYFQWKQSRPYHIDYCFVPEAWASHLVSVEVGSYEQWADLSDHRPVIVDFAFPEGASAKRPGNKYRWRSRTKASSRRAWASMTNRKQSARAAHAGR